MLSSLKSSLRNTRISKPEISLLIILLLFGIPMIILIPPGAGYDEEDHLVRVWELSTFSFIPGSMRPQEMRYPAVYRDFAYRQQGSTGVIDAEFWQSYAKASLYERGFVRRDLDTKSVYSPALLLPQALVLRLFGRVADLPALPVFYLSRLASLLSYLILAWLAIRWIPFGKWILLVLVSSPIALFQATTLSPDAISNGIGFLFIAGCISLNESGEPGWKEAGYLIILVFLLFLAKLNFLPLLLLPFLLLPPARFMQKKVYASMLAAIFILFIVEVAGWNWIAFSKLDPLLSNEANPLAQLLHILRHPFAFLQTLLKDVLANGWIYFQGWLNGYGYYYWTPPLLVSIFYLSSLGSVIFMESNARQMNRRLRAVLMFVFVAGYITTIVSIYLSFSPVGSQQVFGVQGRYFIPLMLLPILVLASFAWTKKVNTTSPKWVIIFLTTALSLNLLGLFLAFHVPCGSTFYQTGLCYRPLFRDFPSNVHLSPRISQELTLTQEIRVTCNGLAELRVLLVPSGMEDREMTHFVLRDAETSEILMDTVIASDQVSTEDWYSLDFAPAWDSAGKHYRLEIRGTSGSSDIGLQVLYTPQSEFNLGDLHQNGQILEEDIVLQYGCVTGLRKIRMTGTP